MNAPVRKFTPPFFVYLAFFMSACAGTLALLAWPYFASRRRDGLIQFAMSIVYPLVGIVVWVGSFLLSDMVLMCRLF